MKGKHWVDGDFMHTINHRTVEQRCRCGSRYVRNQFLMVIMGVRKAEIRHRLSGNIDNPTDLCGYKAYYINKMQAESIGQV